MAKLGSVEELDRLRTGRQQAQRVERETGTHIYIGMGTCGIAAGAKEILSAIQLELASRRIDAEISAVGCIGLCAKEPLVDVQQAGGMRVTYANVRPDMIPRIIEDHLVKGRPVKEWTFGRLASEGI